MRTIRVKTNNQAAIMEALIKSGFTAQACEAPLSEKTLRMTSFFLEKEEARDIESIDTAGMSGIQTSASGTQAHKIIQSLKAEGVIK
jgi:hypothetical protein